MMVMGNVQEPNNEPLLYGPDNKPLPPPPAPEPQTTAHPASAKTTPVQPLKKPFWRSRITGTITVVSLLASFGTFYQLRPKPTAVGVVPTNTPDPHSTRFSLTNAGDISMRHVEVWCDYTEVIFERSNSFLIRDKYLASMYRVPDVAGGEGFTVKCAEPWRLFTSDDGNDVILTMGDLAPQFNARSFYFKKDAAGQIQPSPMPPNQHMICPKCVIHPLSDMDLTIIIKYDTFLLLISFKRAVRLTGIQATDGLIAWQAVPLSQAPIKALSLGMTFELAGAAIYATNDPSKPITMPKF